MQQKQSTLTDNPGSSTPKPLATANFIYFYLFCFILFIAGEESSFYPSENIDRFVLGQNIYAREMKENRKSKTKREKMKQ